MKNLLLNKADQFYKNRYLATVTIENGKIMVLGGMPEKRLLRHAKMETRFCYVKLLPGGQELKLNLVGDDWKPELSTV